MDNKTGAVRVMLGGRNYSRSQFNRAVSNNRLPGSAFKPFVYMGALEFLGYTPATVVTDEQATFNIPGTAPWEPKNFEDHYYGSLILKKALMKSINVVSAKMVAQLTPQTVINVARQFGIVSPLGSHYSLALGTSPVSPLEMASAYSVIANLGMLYEPYFIQRVEDFQGNRLYEHFHRGVRRFPRKTVYPLLDMMRGVVEDGTGRIVRKMGFDHPAAGKTGTTNDSKDAWFIGFTKDITTSVWVGKDDNEPMLDRNRKGMTGSEAAAPIWVFLMQKALEGKSKLQFPVPDGIAFVDVDASTGQPPDFATREIMRVALEENGGGAAVTEYQEDAAEAETENRQANAQH
jgi:penicillin-binding protein 1A